MHVLIAEYLERIFPSLVLQFGTIQFNHLKDSGQYVLQKGREMETKTGVLRTATTLKLFTQLFSSCTANFVLFQIYLIKREHVDTASLLFLFFVAVLAAQNLSIRFATDKKTLKYSKILLSLLCCRKKLFKRAESQENRIC